jgi:superfamily II DNA helicase RecQ
MSWRTKLAEISKVESYFIITQQTIYGIVESSRNHDSLLSEVSGLGGEGKKRKSYGAATNEIITNHRKRYPR